MTAFVLFLVVLWLLAVFADSNLLFGMVWSLLSLYVGSRVWTRRNAASLMIERYLVDRAYTGDEIDIETRVRNTGIFPIPWADLEDSFPMELTSLPVPARVITLGAHREERFYSRLHCNHRGYYRIGPLRIRTGDLLGFDQRSTLEGELRRIIVYPRVLSLQRLGLPTRSALVALRSRNPSFEDSSRLVGVREYVPTDSLRRVHWPATARTGQLMVKQFEHAIARTTMLCLDLCLRNYNVQLRHQAIEQAIVVAASLASHSVTRERLMVGLRVEGQDPLAVEVHTVRLPPGSDPEHLMSILEILARVQAVGGESFNDALRDEGVNLPWGSTIVAITGSPSAGIVETLHFLQHTGHAVALILVSPECLLPPVPAIPVHRVWTDGELAAI